MSGRAKRRSGAQRLLMYHEIPEWQRDNEYLLTGYRPTSNSWSLSFRSVTMWHNETVNIHSHGIGAVLFAVLPFHFLRTLYWPTDSAESTDLLAFVLYCIGVSICFVFSSCCHIGWNHSPAVASAGNKMDFSGIIVLMWGASCASIHFALVCSPMLRISYHLAVTAGAAGCVALTLRPSFITPKYRVWRAIMYASFGLSAVGFILHSIYLYGFDTQRRRLALEWMVLMAVLNVLGAVIYALRIPEILQPCTFDLIGASHQIFHLLVLLAGIAHYKGLCEAFLEVRVRQETCSTLTSN